MLRVTGREASGSFSGLEAQSPFRGIERHALTTAHATVSQYTFEPGATFPIHRHPQEQITLVLEGSLEMTIDGRTQSLRAGDWSVVAGDVEHGITAGPDGSRFLAIVVPARAGSDDYEVTNANGGAGG